MIYILKGRSQSKKKYPKFIIFLVRWYPLSLQNINIKGKVASIKRLKHLFTAYSIDYSKDYSIDYSIDYYVDYSIDYSINYSLDYSLDYSLV